MINTRRLPTLVCALKARARRGERWDAGQGRTWIPCFNRCIPSPCWVVKPVDLADHGSGRDRGGSPGHSFSPSLRPPFCLVINYLSATSAILRHFFFLAPPSASKIQNKPITFSSSEIMRQLNTFVSPHTPLFSLRRMQSFTHENEEAPHFSSKKHLSLFI